ncbi:MAG: Clp protease ClpP [Clostridia bacterium]|nr:Clp protease ClpP [Clostridia bacterium]
MRKIHIKGVIISNDVQWIYELFDIECTSPNMVNAQLEEANGEDIEVIINSGGGEVYAGSEIYTALKDYPGKVTVKIVGIAASAASIIAMAGDKVLISPTAQIMIHTASNVSKGDYRVHQSSSDFLRNWDKSIANAYMLKTGMTQEELLELMDKETWLTAQQALEKGFVDEIMFEDSNQPKLVASAGYFEMIPQKVIDKIKNEIKKGALQNMIEINKKGERIMDLEQLINEYPDLYEQVKNEGIKEERERIKAIEEIAMPGNEDIINKAKFETGITAEEVAVEILKAEKQRAVNFLKKREEDAKDLSNIEPGSAPQDDKETQNKKVAENIAAAINKRRGIK